MKFIIFPVLFFNLLSYGQMNTDDAIQGNSAYHNVPKRTVPTALSTGKVRIAKSKRWRLDGNKILSGGLLFTSGAAKGFNEGLQFNYFGFEDIFPKANDQWFYPAFSFKNKYKDGDPAKGPKFPFSTSVLVMFTDQYHLNNFIQRAALTAALVIKIGERKKPFRHYLFDVVYYTICYQAGFHAIYDPIAKRN